MAITALELVRLAENRKIPAAWTDARQGVADDFDWYQRAIADPLNRVYGANTLTGHLDGHCLSGSIIDSLQSMILQTHRIGQQPYFDEMQARLIGYTKACAASLGGTGLSPELYGHLLEAVSDDAFRPLVPRSASYSCGDVIPGAHWADALIQHRGFIKRHPLRPGEGLALVNGSFVDVGSTIALLPEFHAAILDMLCNMWTAARVFGQSPASVQIPRRGQSPALAALELIARDLAAGPTTGAQLPVSLRSTPELVDLVLGIHAQILATLDKHLHRGSANPYVCRESGQIVSQASFMAPDLSVVKSSLCETLLFAMWACQSRIEAVCSQLEAEAVTQGETMFLVQIPKLTQAMLEESRVQTGRRTFASGSSTSKGVEDLWTLGTTISSQIQMLLAQWRRLEAAQHRLLSVLEAAPGKRRGELAGLRSTLFLEPDAALPLRAEFASVLGLD